jgi:hypothetical protein
MLVIIVTLYNFQTLFIVMLSALIIYALVSDLILSNYCAFLNVIFTYTAFNRQEICLLHWNFKFDRKCWVH